MQDPLLELHSPLYDRYNGFLLGAVFAASYGTRQRARFASWRAQMQGLLDEVEAGVQLPETHEAFHRTHAALMPRLLSALGECSPQLKNFFLLGCVSLQWLGLEDDERRAELRRLGRRILDAHELPKDTWDEALHGSCSAHDPLRRVMLLLTRSLRNVALEPEACFVALPPGQDFAQRYELFYAELLRACGRRPLRSWDGFGGERRQEMLVQVLQRCGALLADVSDYAPGVVFELGVARGAGARTYLFTSTPSAPPPCDLDLAWVCGYEPDQSNWLHSALSDGVFFLSAVDAVIDGCGESLGDSRPQEVIARLQRAERFAAETLEP